MRALDQGTHFSVTVAEDELRERNLPAEALCFWFSKSDGSLAETVPPQPIERLKGELAPVVLAARECGARNLKSAGHLKLTRLMHTYLEACRKNPKAVVLIRLGDAYEALMHHAAPVSTALGLPLTRRTNTPMCAVPAEFIDSACARLKELGREVTLAEYEKSRGAANDR